MIYDCLYNIEEIEELQGEGAWKEILRNMAHRIGLHAFKFWLRGLGLSDLESPYVRIKTHSNFKKDRILIHYYNDLVSAIQSVLPTARLVEVLAYGEKSPMCCLDEALHYCEPSLYPENEAIRSDCSEGSEST